jgi:hypothetical protein
MPLSAAALPVSADDQAVLRRWANATQAPATLCARCQTIRREPPAGLLAHHDPGEPWLKWRCPIEGCGHRVIGPWELEDHAAAAHPGWVATYELVRPYPNQLQRVVYRQVQDPPAT